jgi:CRP-like cAMP-binding protein
MLTRFRKYIGSMASFSDEEFERIKAHTKLKRIRKRQYFLQEGDVCQHVIWVGKGCLRLFLVDSGGREHIIDFGLENDFFTDRLSFANAGPSLYNIDALEDTEVLLFTPDALELLTETMPSFAKVLRIANTQHLANLQSRITATLTLSADEKYKTLLRQNPELVQRLPQHMIASYLGITPATLSRVRKKFAMV